MFHLYYTLESTAMGCHAALEEIGAPFELHPVDTVNPRPPEYLALNPNGKVPTLIDERDDGERLMMFQSGGILLYLADRHPEAALAPPPGSRGRRLCYQWLALLGADFSVCDLYLHTLSRWQPTGFPAFDEFPNAARCAALVAERPAVQRMMAVQCPEAA